MGKFSALYRLHKKYLTVFLTVVFVTVAAFATTFAETTKGTVGEPTSSASLSRRVELTEEEKAYLKTNPVIVVAADASWRPLEYKDMETGKYAGIIAEVLERLGRYTGFKIEYKIMPNYRAAIKAVQSGESDILSGLAYDNLMADEFYVHLTKPYIKVNSAVVTKDGGAALYNGSQKKTIAVVDEDYANTKIEKTIVGAKLVKCASNEECLQLVEEGKVDMAIVASYSAEYFMSIPKYSNLKSHTISDFSWDMAFGVNKNADPRLISILNKGIDKMAGLDLNEAIYDGVIKAAYSNDWMILVYKHPLAIIAIMLVIFGIIGALFYALQKNKQKESLRRIEDGTRLKLALERTHLCIWELDLEKHRITNIENPKEKHGFGNLRDGIPEKIIAEGYVHPDDVPLVREVLDKVNRGEQDVQGCWRIKDLDSKSKDTIYWWEQVLFHIITDSKGRPVKAIGVSEDVTKEKNAQRDSLTLVYNRNSFEQMASRVLNERRNAYLKCAFVILDLDGFKQINDTYGHGMGDRVLISVGAALNKTFRSSDIVGRLGGDEFTVFMTAISKSSDAEVKAKELVENIAKLQEREGFPFPISCSVGIVVATKGQDELAVLYKKADTALYEAKHAGKNQYKMYLDK